MNAAWRSGSRGEQHTACKWGIAGQVLYGGTLDVDNRNLLPPALGGRGNLVGSYVNATSLVVSVYGIWSL